MDEIARVKYFISRLAPGEQRRQHNQSHSFKTSIIPSPPNILARTSKADGKLRTIVNITIFYFQECVWKLVKVLRRLFLSYCLSSTLLHTLITYSTAYILHCERQ